MPIKFPRDKKIPADRMTERLKQMKDASEKANEECLTYDKNYKVYGSEGRKYFGGWTPPEST